jgi:hypothetical protein
MNERKTIDDTNFTFVSNQMKFYAENRMLIGRKRMDGFEVKSELKQFYTNSYTTTTYRTYKPRAAAVLLYFNDRTGNRLTFLREKIRIFSPPTKRNTRLLSRQAT